MKKCFLDIDMGNAEQYEKDKLEYDIVKEWLTENAATFAVPASPRELNDEQRALVRDVLEGDARYSDRKFRFDEVPPLRVGRLEVELYEKESPRTVANFEALCRGDRGLGKASKKPLHYKGVPIHRIVRNFVMQGGDIVRGDGSGGDSIYNGTFNDERGGLKLKHAKGTLSMANSGKNSNTSQFFIVLADEAPKLDGKHVVFGRVAADSLPIIERIHAHAASDDGKPRVDVRIADCGVL